MTKLWKIPRQTRCPECGEVFDTPPATMTKNAGIPLIYVDEESGTYNTDCPQCGQIVECPLDIWE